MTHPLTQTLSRLFLLGVLLSFALGLNYLNAWTAPTLAPTGGNVAAPLNTSGNVQSKSGGLQMSSLDITGTNGVSLSGGQLSFWNGSAIELPLYTIDMGDLDPGANNGIRFPDDTVQTSAASGGAVEVSEYGTITSTGRNMTTTLGTNWTLMIISVQQATGGGDSTVAPTFIFKSKGAANSTAIGILQAGQARQAVRTISSTKYCVSSGNATETGSYDSCFQLVGSDVFVDLPAGAQATYIVL